MDESSLLRLFTPFSSWPMWLTNEFNYRLCEECCYIFFFRIPLFVLSKHLVYVSVDTVCVSKGKKMKIHHCGLNCLRRENIHATFYIYVNINLPYKGVWIGKEKRVSLCEKERTWEELIQNERESYSKQSRLSAFFLHIVCIKGNMRSRVMREFNKSAHTKAMCLLKLFSLSLFISRFFFGCVDKNSIFFTIYDWFLPSSMYKLQPGIFFSCVWYFF